MKGRDTLFSSASNEWETPQELFDSIHEEFQFTVDCAASHKNKKLPKYWTIEDDGLAQNWDKERVWCNPPYSNVASWVEKASSSKGLVVMLLPARTCTKWFHKYIYRKPKVEIHFLQGRLKFSGSKNSAPFPSMVVIFNPKVK